MNIKVNVLIVLLIIVSFSCSLKNKIEDKNINWTFGKVLYVDSTEVVNDTLEYFSVQIYPKPNEYRFSRIFNDPKFSFKLGGLKTKISYKIEVKYGPNQEDTFSQNIIKPDEDIVLNIFLPKTMPTNVNPLILDEPSGGGIPGIIVIGKP